MDHTRELERFSRGESTRAYSLLGCHPAPGGGFSFAVWAPNAQEVSVVGGFNGWMPEAAPMERLGDSGVFTATVPGAMEGQLYKYAIITQNGTLLYKADPYAFATELRPGTASRIQTLPRHTWQDEDYLAARAARDPFASPMSVYEVHLGSWRGGQNLRTLATELVDYAAGMGYTHIELLPVAEYPLDASWGYQVTGYYAVSARYGTPADLMYFVDCAHAKGLGVLVDWVGAHFPRDDHGLRLYDGTPLYEHPDPRRSEQPQWGTLLFDYARNEARSFLLSNAHYLLEEYHIDGLRVDAVSCMLYLDYGKGPGQWLPNPDGGNVNHDAVSFLRQLCRSVGLRRDGSLLFAEESSAYPLVTKPPEDGGLGFHFKWNMGWMHDTLRYMGEAPEHRKFHHDKLTFSLCYAFSENFVLPFSHDEVVHGKRSLIERMPGDTWQKFASLRLTYAYQFAHPGKKLMFMGQEFAQFIEWRYYEPLEWFLLDYPLHRAMQEYVRALNRLYVSTPALYQRDCGWDGFEWVQVCDRENSVFAALRRDAHGQELLCSFNFTPTPHRGYVLWLDRPVRLQECFNSDDAQWGGSGDWNNPRPISARLFEGHHRPYAVSVTLPPLGAVFFRVKEGGRPMTIIEPGGDKE